MQAITTIGLDIAKSVFQVHGVDAAGQVVIRRQLTQARKPHQGKPKISVNKAKYGGTILFSVLNK